MPITLKGLLVAIIFGLVAWVIVISGLHLPIPNTSVVTDPREFATTLGAALSGPIGGIIIGILAGIAEPGGIPLASILAHVVGGIWMGIAYKLFVFKFKSTGLLLLGWFGAICAYYFIFVIPGFAVGLKIFYQETTPWLPFYLELASGIIPEFLFTSFVTLLVLISLPKLYRKPLW